MRALSLGALPLALSVCALAAEHKDSWQRTFLLSGTGAKKLSIGIINGNIRVTGDSGQDIRVTVREEYEAGDAADLAAVRNDFRVQIAQDGNAVRFFLDPPKHERDGRYRGKIDFRHDFEVLVPRDIELSLRTINGGQLSVANVNGTWDLKNINGGVELKDMGGHGRAETLNGSLRATFRKNPDQSSQFKNLNGVVDVSFQPDLSADLALSTMHGEAYTDFDVTPLASSAQVQKSEHGLRYRVSDRNRKLRVGSGGIEHSFSTLNGSIKIRKYGNKL